MSFEKQLEFVQALASPQYLACMITGDGKCIPDAATVLAQTGQLEDVRLINYLSHLSDIWVKDPNYARFVSYPASLHHLEMLKSPQFRKALIHAETVDRLSADLLQDWHGKVKPELIKEEPV